MPVDIYTAICLYWSRASDRSATQQALLRQNVWGLNRSGREAEGRELQVSTRRPPLSLSNASTWRQSIKPNQCSMVVTAKLTLRESSGR
jgi:hypothetical protein